MTVSPTHWAGDQSRLLREKQASWKVNNLQNALNFEARHFEDKSYSVQEPDGYSDNPVQVIFFW